MIEIILAPGEVDSHVHADVSSSMLEEGKVSLNMNGETVDMVLGHKYIIPENTVHTMTNLSDNNSKVVCFGQHQKK